MSLIAKDLLRKRKYQKAGRDGWIDLPNNERIIYNYRRENPGMTISDLCVLSRFEIQTVINAIRSLIRKGLLEPESIGR